MSYNVEKGGIKKEFMKEKEYENIVFVDYNSNSTGKRKRKRKKNSTLRKAVPIISLFAVVFVFVGAAGIFLSHADDDDAKTAGSHYNPMNLSAVSNTKITDTTDKTLSVSWNKVDRAEGYHIYMSESSKDCFARVKTVKGGDSLKCKISDLEQAQRYSLYVTAFAKDSESSEFKSVDNICTLPKKSKITLAESQREGILRIEWEKNENADGYLIEYKTKDSKKYPDGSNIWIDENTECIKEIPQLEPLSEYSVRICAYTKSGKILLGAPSDEKNVQIADTELKLSPGIDVNKPMVALSFDDGPGNGNSGDRILNTLEKYNAKATFFMVGNNAADHPDNVKRKAELGMEIGNHTWDHTHYGDDVTAKDIRKASDKISEIAGQRVTAFRSPGGLTTKEILDECKYEHLTSYYWTIDTRDWDSRDATQIYNTVMSNVKNGDIILMHEIYDATADAVEKIIPALQKQGYQIVSCKDLVISKSGYAPEIGVEYTSGVSKKTITE